MPNEGDSQRKPLVRVMKPPLKGGYPDAKVTGRVHAASARRLRLVTDGAERRRHTYREAA